MRTLSLAVLACLALPVTASQAKEISRNYDETFPVEAGAILRLDHGDGNVTLVPWERDEIRVEVRYRADFSQFGIGGEPDFRVEFEQDDRTVRVVGREVWTDGMDGFIGVHASRVELYEYEVHLPAWVDLECRGEDGSVKGEGMTGAIHWRLDDGDLELSGIRSSDANLRVEDGDVFLEDFEGPLVLETDDGDIRMERCRTDRARIVTEDGEVTLRECSGELAIRTDDGDVRARRMPAGRIEIRTGDGGVQLDLVPASSPPDVDVETDDGDVSVQVADGISAEYLVATDEGRVRVRANAARQEEERHSAYGVLGNGDGEIRIRTRDGSVRLESRDASS